MGLYDRDYIRDDHAGRRWLTEPGAACKSIIALSVLVFFSQLATDAPNFNRDQSGVTYWLGYRTDLVFQGQIWRLLTYGFCHDTNGIWHLAINMVILWFFGRELEDIYGPKEIFTFYLVGVVFSAFTHLAIGMVIPNREAVMDRWMIGGSGGVMAAFCLFAMHYPYRTVLIMFVLPIQIRWLLLIYVGYDLVPVIHSLRGRDAHDGIGHAAHLGGLLFGFLYYRLQWRLLGTLRGWTSWLRRRGAARKPALKVFREAEPAPAKPTLQLRTAESDDLGERLDEVLQKISQHGESSLTPAERQVLVDASQRYRQRQQPPRTEQR